MNTELVCLRDKVKETLTSMNRCKLMLVERMKQITQFMTCLTKLLSDHLKRLQMIDLYNLKREWANMPHKLAKRRMEEYLIPLILIKSVLLIKVRVSKQVRRSIEESSPKTQLPPTRTEKFIVVNHCVHWA